MNANATSAIVLMSGGLDSALCAHFLKSKGVSVSSCFIAFGQAAARQELAAAERVSHRLAIPLEVFNVTANHSFPTGELLGRNAFLAATALFLTSARAPLYAMGIHAGTGYYDCSRPFARSMSRLFRETTNGASDFVAPFVDLTKRDIINLVLASDIDPAATYSCEAGETPPCGRCRSCRDRVSLGC